VRVVKVIEAMNNRTTEAPLAPKPLYRSSDFSTRQEAGTGTTGDNVPREEGPGSAPSRGQAGASPKGGPRVSPVPSAIVVTTFARVPSDDGA